MSFTTAIHTSPSVFSELAPEWHELLKRAQENHFFYTPEFLASWWNTLGTGTLQVITVRDETNTLIGIAPLFIVEYEHKPQLCFVGCAAVADYLDCIIQAKNYSAVYEAIFHAVRQLDFEIVHLCSIPDNSPTKTLLPAAFPLKKLTVTQQDICPQIQLPRDWEHYLESLERKQRHEVRRKLRKLDLLKQYQVTIITDPQDIDDAIATFISLHKASSPGKKRFWDEHHVAFFTLLLKRTAAAGWLKLFFLEIDNTFAATMLIFDYNNRYYLYNSGFNPEFMPQLSTGSSLTALTIKDAIDNSRAVYDFLRGDEQYKFRLGGKPVPVWDILNSPIS